MIQTQMIDEYDDEKRILMSSTETVGYFNSGYFTFIPNRRYYYLKEISSKLKESQYIRKDTYIVYDKNQEFINKFANLLKNNLTKIVCDNELFSEDKQFPNLIIEWITISYAKVIINSIYTICKFQLTAKSKMQAFNSIFIPQSLSKTESSIEIFANSRASFRNCHFYDAERVGVIVRNYSSAQFENCVFINNVISCFISDDSYAEFINCTFINDKKISVFVTKDSKCQMINCTFKQISGKALFAKDSSNVYLKNINFIDCQKGAATIINNSTLFLDGGINIEGSKNTAIHAVDNSHIYANDCKLVDIEGNGFNFDNSDGYVVNCEMERVIYPTIAVLGLKSNPIFVNCKLTKNGDTFCVICKNSCRPLFTGCHFANCSTNCFSVSDFSRPHIENCSFEDIEKKYINVLSGSYVTNHNLVSIDKFNIFTKIQTSPCSFCLNQSLTEVMLEEDKKNNQNNESDDKDDLDDQNHCKSWRSPTYELPPEITEMKTPDEIADLVPLKKIKLSSIVKSIGNQPVTFICSVCRHELHEEDEPNIICPCGHIICPKCKNISKCPICDSPVKEIKKIFFEEFCAICLENKPNTISLPCGHCCMCYECASKCSQNHFNCPLCNGPLISYKYVFKDTCIKKENPIIIKSQVKISTKQRGFNETSKMFSLKRCASH